MRRAEQPETTVQREVRKVYEAAGCFAATLSRKGRFGPRGTGQTPGVSDLYLLHRRIGGWWHETKTDEGRMSSAQENFANKCEEAGVPCVVGGVQEALEFLQEAGI